MSVATHPYVVPRSSGSGGAWALATIMHVLLGLFLFLGISWQSSKPTVIEAELWSSVPQFAAPPPAPVVAVTPPPAPVEKETPPDIVKPDIAIKNTVVEKPKPKPAPLPPPPKPAPPEVKAVAKPPPKAEAKPLAPPSDLASLLASADKASTGTAAQTSGPRGQQDYMGKLQAKIRSNMRFPRPQGIQGNPTVEINIEQLPNGEVSSVTVVRSSGLPAFDEAVQRAVEASSPLPKPDQGKVSPRLGLLYHLDDLP